MKSCTEDIFNQNKWTAQTLKIHALFLSKGFWVVVFLLFPMLEMRNVFFYFFIYKKNISLYIYKKYCLEK